MVDELESASLFKNAQKQVGWTFIRALYLKNQTIEELIKNIPSEQEAIADPVVYEVIESLGPGKNLSTMIVKRNPNIKPPTWAKKAT